MVSKRLNLRVLLKQKKAQLRGEKKQFEQDAVESAHCVVGAVEISSGGEGIPEVARDCSRTGEAESDGNDCKGDAYDSMDTTSSCPHCLCSMGRNEQMVEMCSGNGLSSWS